QVDLGDAAHVHPVPVDARNVRPARIVIEAEHVAVELARLGDLFGRGPDANTVVMQLQHFHRHESLLSASKIAPITPICPVYHARLPRVPQVGSPLPRPDDPRLLTGRGRFVDDVTLPRMVHVAFVRSVHAHALISALELEAARHAPGVVAVLTGEDAGRLCKPCRGVLLHYQGMKTGAMRPLAVERVRYVGEPVVAIAAETRAAAEDACARVRIDWTPLPAVLSAEQAVAAGAPLIHADLPDNVIYDTRLSGGDAPGALAGAHRV